MASSNTNDIDNSSALPTFLANDPYPTTNDGRPTTASSTAPSELDGTPVRESAISLSAIGPVGEPGLPPSRPASGALSQQSWARTSDARWSRDAPSSPRGYRPFSRRDGDQSRPGSGIPQTHVPSLTPQGFFRPMSPQKLQAQRGQPVAPPKSSMSGHQLQGSMDELKEEERITSLHSYTNSITSVRTNRDGDQPFKDPDAPMIPPLPFNSRGERGLSIPSDTDAANAGPGSVVSKNSSTPLHSRQHTNATQKADPNPRSSRSLRNSLGFGSRQSSRLDVPKQRQSAKDHEKLPSHPATPTSQDEKAFGGLKQPMNNATGKNYEYYAGNMLFFLSGRCLNTKAKPLNVATFVLTSLPAALFFAFSAPWLWHNVSPAMPIVFAYIFYVSMSAFLHAAFSDPGTLPRNIHPHPPNPEEENNLLAVGPFTTDWTLVKTFPSSKQQANLESNAETGSMGGPTTAMEVPTKYCKSCNIWRPPRAHHCRVCDGCIETQDHHCVWLNNCVGRRNYRYFFAYVGFSSIMAFLLIAFSITHIATYASEQDVSFGSALSGRVQERVAFAMFIYAVLALPYPGSLFVYHLFLVARGETTREYLNSHKFLPNDRHRPFSQSSLLRNWAAVLGRPRPPSYMLFKKPYVEGDVRLGHNLRKRERREKENLEAVRSASRVDGLKKRFSVARSGAGTNGSTTLGGRNGSHAGVEMKELPASSNGGDTDPSALKGKRRPSGSNATPR